MLTSATLPRPILRKLVTAHQRRSWSKGDYGRIGTTLQIVGEQLMEALDLHAGRSLLDVAGGNGNASLAAARRYCDVTSTDFVPQLLQQGHNRAVAEGLEMAVQEADAEALPFEDASYDYVVSTFGVMFAPRQRLAAAELQRVCKQGGRIGLASWCPDGFVGQYFELLCRYRPLPDGVKMPSRWGTEAFIEEQFGTAKQIRHHRRQLNFRYRSAAHWQYVFTTFCGMTLQVLKKLDKPTAARLMDDILALAERYNRASDGTLVIPSDYLQTVIEL
ncbi:class I SAM-dependent methyltransferase [Motiliproteus coralliicola]|uniref:Class I SAM-dependent methyltransferase n=1 Tax=Motiliproteus coralliicola TaxID=2283196 RepID=A0A369WEQ9_9GAMM|nr:class I SAM-dependent methyltransferase [Motiliproteus coralliicola]